MKKHVLSLALVATMIGTIAAGCSSSEKATGSSDTSKMDTMKSMSAPKDTMMKTDTMKRDTTKTPPKM